MAAVAAAVLRLTKRSWLAAWWLFWLAAGDDHERPATQVTDGSLVTVC
jgi:hypothetical protein